MIFSSRVSDSQRLKIHLRGPGSWQKLPNMGWIQMYKYGYTIKWLVRCSANQVGLGWACVLYHVLFSHGFNLITIIPVHQFWTLHQEQFLVDDQPFTIYPIIPLLCATGAHLDPSCHLPNRLYPFQQATYWQSKMIYLLATLCWVFFAELVTSENEGTIFLQTIIRNHTSDTSPHPILS